MKCIKAEAELITQEINFEKYISVTRENFFKVK